MGKPTGFMEFGRELPGKDAPELRVKHYKEFVQDDAFGERIHTQAARCMDCGVPFCHSGCPIGNIIPEFNDAVYRKNWKQAWDILSTTNNFPEFTGRVCPAPCESACVLGINQDPITICNIEKNIAEQAYANGYVTPANPVRTGKTVAVVGSGPAGMAAAEQLNKAGHSVTVFERDEEPGGLLRFGIPDFKLDKQIVKRKVDVMRASGIEFRCSTAVGKDISAQELEQQFDAVVLACGSTIPRDLPVTGRDAKGVHFAMEFLTQNTRRVTGISYSEEDILATDKDVVVIGGGDTGSDCVGTSNRHGARSITQLELMPEPPTGRPSDTPWPTYPRIKRTSTSHDEGVDRLYSVLTKEFVKDENGQLAGVRVVDLQWDNTPGQRPSFTEVEGSERVLPAQLVTLAMGFLHTDHQGPVAQFALELDERGNVKANNFATSKAGVYSCGDMRRGQSLVVWAIHEGRECAVAVDNFLMGNSNLEQRSDSLLMAR